MATPTEPCTRIDVQRTQIAVQLVSGRHRASLRSGLLRPQLVHSRPDRCRIALVATTALLLGGDSAELCVEVGPGATVELFDVAGTVAFDGRGRPAFWRVKVTLAEGASLRLSGEPFVVADGAAVTRSFELDLAGTATALMRETVVLGRSGERGGYLRNQTSIRVDGGLVCVEDQDFDPETRTLPGLLADLRVLDTITCLGRGTPGAQPGLGTTRFLLFGDAGTVTRYLGQDVASSPLHREWVRLSQQD